jgi:hypothetical protein
MLKSGLVNFARFDGLAINKIAKKAISFNLSNFVNNLLLGESDLIYSTTEIGG